MKYAITGPEGRIFKVLDEPTAESEILNKSEEADVEEKSEDPVMMEVPVSGTRVQKKQQNLI